MPDQLHLFLLDPAPDPAPTSPVHAPLPDAESRARALDIRYSWIVEAPAGSGKTGLLIQRFLRLLADPSVHSPEQVLAITFTKKASAEMRDRVLAQLQSAAAGSPPENEFDSTTRTLAEAVLNRDQAREPNLRWSLPDNSRRINIRTIDSVCSEIASLLPILSGSGGRRSPAEDAEPLYALAARRTFLKLGGPDTVLHEALSTVLLHRDGNLGMCERLLAQMLEVRDQWGALIPLGHDLDDAQFDVQLDASVLPRLEHALDQAICAGLSEFAVNIPAPLLESLASIAAEMAHLEGYKGSPSPIALCAGKASSPQAVSEELDRWRALINLVYTASTKDWRKSFSANLIGFQASKSEQAWLKSELSRLIDQLQQIPNISEAIRKFRDLPPATYPADQWRVAKALFRILNHALVELQLVFAERGQCDFTELSLAARTALIPADLESEPDSGSPLEAALGIGLQHLLVDEMQDNSSSQYELIQSLTRGWDGYSQTVFLVGDPKQSIYLFRQARVERFLRTLHSGHLGDLPLGRLQLTANFRSQADLVYAFNIDFESIFPTASPTLHPEDVPFVPATAARRGTASASSPNLEAVISTEASRYAGRSGETPGFAIARHSAALGAPSIAVPRDGWEVSNPARTNGFLAVPRKGWDENRFDVAASAAPASPRVWHASILPHSEKKPGEPSQAAINTRRQRRADAREVRGIIESWRARPLPPGRTSPWKIAVLCRSRNHLDEIVAAFKRDPAIPFRAVDVDPLKDCPEVQDIFALTRALLHPADRIAWLSLLRAPWCGLTLAELHILTGEDDPLWAERTVSSLISERAHLLSSDSCQRLERIWPVLEAATRARSRLPLAQLIERTWRSLGGDTWLDPVQLTNVARYLQLLDDLEAEFETRGQAGLDPGRSSFDLPLLERRLDRLYAAPAVHTDAVDLLTIHRAKGLEWDVVIVPGLDRPPAFNRYRFLNWIELDSSDEESAHVLLAPIAGKGEDADPLYKWIYRVRAARENAETKRLFYVACTRAREELHLFASITLTANGGLKPRLSSLLEAAWPAAQPVFAAIPVPVDQKDDLQDEAESSFITALAAQATSRSAAFGSKLATSEDTPGNILDTAASEDPAEPDDLIIPSVTAFADEWDTGDKSLLAFPPSERRTTPLKRLSLAFDPAAHLRTLPSFNYAGRSDRYHNADPADSESLPPRFDRPEGSLAARALGNAVHAFLEKIATEIVAKISTGIATSHAPAALLAALASWTPRMTAVLRSEGLPPTEINRLLPRVRLALENTLKDPTGLWLLSPHDSAAAEYALTSQLSALAPDRTNIRIDRVFRAGPEPLAPGTTHLWIVDYKTSTRSPENRASENPEAFLAAERARYSPQLEAYATVLRQIVSHPTESEPAIRLALYYPMLPKLIWWQPA